MWGSAVYIWIVSSSTLEKTFNNEYILIIKRLLELHEIKYTVIYYWNYVKT